MVVSNTGPLIALVGVGQLELLRSMFDWVVVARSVYLEITSSRCRLGADLFESRDWVQVHEDPPPVDRWLWMELDAGEAATIALASAIQPDAVLLDERKARRAAAELYGLPVRGTGGILLRAKRLGMIPAIRPLLEDMRRNGYFLSDRLIEGLTQAAGE